MTTREQQLWVALELHSPERMRALFDAGLAVDTVLNGQTPLEALLEMYTRSDRFADCLRVLLERGARLEDAALRAVLLDEPAALSAALRADPARLGARTTLRSTFTPLEGVTLLHIAAEYGQLAAARRLIELGAEVDARAALDAHGLGGHTPLFHTVNSNENRALPLLELLLAAGASPATRVAGLCWGRGFEWESTFFDLTPLAYAQLGTLPQMHRRERDVDAVVRCLLAAAGRPIPPLANVPNRYVARSSAG